MSRRRSSRGRTARPAFTLAELLVVIGLISTLVGIAIPACAKARVAADSTACLANLRQWAVALHLHAAAHRGDLPRRGQGVQPTNQIARPGDWFNALPAALRLERYADLAAADRIPRPGGGRSIWTCPSAPGRDGKYFWSYAMNMALSVENGGQNQGRPDKLTGVGNASVMAFMADGPWNYGSTIPSALPDGYNPVPRHGGGRVNLAFLDGHVASFDAAYLGVGRGLLVDGKIVERFDVRWHPPRSTWNSAP